METATADPTRLRFDSLDYVTTPDGSGRVSVRLEWDGERYEGTAACLETQQGVLRAAAKATLVATMTSSAGGQSSSPLDLEVLGVKAVRAFDGWVVVTRIHGQAGAEQHRLLGAAPCESEDELPAAAVRAALDASQQLLEQRFEG